MRDKQRVVMLNDYEHRVMVRGLAGFRNDVLREGKPTEDVDGLLLKVIDAPKKKARRRSGREAR